MAYVGGRREVRGRPRGARDTRDALLRVAVRLLESEGESAISTTRLTREAGIVQSGFYNHFPSLDACLAEAATLVTGQVRGPVRESMHRLRREEAEQAESTGAVTGEAARAHFRRVLDLLAPRWPVLAALQTGGRRDGPVGAAIGRLRQDVVSDVADYLRLFAADQGVDMADDDPRIEILAVLLTDLTLSTAAERAHNPGVDHDLLATMLTDCSRAMVVRIIHGDGRELTWFDPSAK